MTRSKSILLFAQATFIAVAGAGWTNVHAYGNPAEGNCGSFLNCALVVQPGATEGRCRALNGEIDRMVQTPNMKERMAGEGMESAGSSPERFREVLKSARLRSGRKW